MTETPRSLLCSVCADASHVWQCQGEYLAQKLRKYPMNRGYLGVAVLAAAVLGLRRRCDLSKLWRSDSEGRNLSGEKGELIIWSGGMDALYGRHPVYLYAGLHRPVEEGW